MIGPGRPMVNSSGYGRECPGACAGPGLANT